MSGLEALFALGAAETTAGAALGSGLTVPAAISTGELLGTSLIPAAAETTALGSGLSAVASTSPFYEAPFAASTISPAAQAAGITLGSGLIPSATTAFGTPAAAGLTPMQALNMGKTGLQAAQLISGDGKRSAYSPAPMNRGRQVNLASPVQSLLAEQPKPRRKPTLSLLG